MMRSIILTTIGILLVTTVSAQFVRTDYFLSNSQTRSMMNPALRPNQGYLGMPFASTVGVGVYTNFFYLDNFVFKRNDEWVTFMHPSVATADFLSNLPDNNYLNVDVNYKMFSLGLYGKKNSFWTVDLGVRVLTEINIPKQFFEFMKIGFSQNESDAVAYSLHNLQASALAYTELGIGHSKSLLKDKLQLGVRLKALVGLSNLNMNIEQLNVSAQNNEWRVLSKATLSGSNLKPTYNEKDKFNGLEPKFGGLGGLGVGLDIGGAFKFLKDRIHISFALNDIGFISWSKSNYMNLKSPDTEILIAQDDIKIESGKKLVDQLDAIKDDLMEAVNFKENNEKKGQKTSLRTNMNAGLAFEIWKNNLSIGLLSSTYVNRTYTMNEITASVNFNPAKMRWFSAALSYSTIQDDFSTIGGVLHITPSRMLGLFVGSDFLIPRTTSEGIPISTKAANFQVGLSIPLNSKKK